MDLLVKELNERQTKTKAKKILRLFRQLQRQAGKTIYLQSPKLTDMPKSQFTQKSFGDRSNRKADAEKECQEIIAALHQLDQKEREVLELTYFTPQKYTCFQIAQQMKYSESRIKQNNLNVFIYAYTVARKQVGLPAKPVLKDDGQLVHDQPEPLEKPLTPQIRAIENHFRNKYLELDELFWQGIDAIVASDQEGTFFRRRVFVLKRFYGLNGTQISKQVGKWGKVITEEVEAGQIAFCQSLGIME